MVKSCYTEALRSGESTLGILKSIIEKPVFKTRITTDEVRFPEIAFGYFLAPFCAMLANSIFAAYLTRYYADVLEWTEFASGLFAAALPIISAFFVVAGNMMIGRWIDNTRTTAGRARPYLALSAPLLFISILLLFSSPNNGSPAQMIWIALSYNLYYAAAYPCYYTAHSSMVSLSTRNKGQKGLLATMSNASMVAAAGIGATILVPVLLQSYMFVYDGEALDISASYGHWRRISAALAVLTAFGVTLEYFFTRERITEERMRRPKSVRVSMRKHMAVCISDKFWWMVILFVLFFQMGQLVKSASMSFYTRWMFDSVLTAEDPEQAAGVLMSTLALIGGLPSAAGMIVAWPLAKKFGKKRMIVAGLLFSIASGFVALQGVHDFATVCAGVVLKQIGIVPAQFVTLAVVSDVLDHLEEKNGFRSDGFTMSVYGSIIVGILGVAVGIVSGLLGAAGYDPELAIQPAAVEKSLVFVYLIMDMIAFAASAALLWKMDVEKYG